MFIEVLMIVTVFGAFKDMKNNNDMFKTYIKALTSLHDAMIAGHTDDTGKGVHQNFHNLFPINFHQTNQQLFGIKFNTQHIYP